MRKCYLGILFVLLVVFWAGCALIKPYHAKTEANMKLISFPEKIPGAYKVIKLIEPEAKYCLVHILNIHIAKDTTDDVYKIVRETQQDIYVILKYLISEISLDRVYKEGKIEDQDNYKRLAEKNNKTFQSFLDRNNIKIPKQIEIDARQVVAKFFSQLRNYKLKIDAVERLKREGVLTILPAERAISSLRHQSLLFFFEWRTMLKGYDLLLEEADEKREGGLLDIIHSNKDTFSVVVYGAGHNWQDNIFDEWNIKKPADKFSLVVIIPKSLKPYLKIN